MTVNANKASEEIYKKKTNKKHKIVKKQADTKLLT